MTTPADRTVIWVHGDCLNPHSPAFVRYPAAPALFVWDDALLAQYRLSLKRITFIYECVLQLPVVIRRGDVATEVVRFAAEHDAPHVVTVESPAPRFATIREEIDAHVRVETLPLPPFLEYRGSLDLARFSKYWRTAERYAFGSTRAADVAEDAE